jgi:hypothetical protein
MLMVADPNMRLKEAHNPLVVEITECANLAPGGPHHLDPADQYEEDLRAW